MIVPPPRVNLNATEHRILEDFVARNVLTFPALLAHTVQILRTSGEKGYEIMGERLHHVIKETCREFERKETLQ